MDKSSQPIKFTAEINEKRRNFEKLLHDFHSHDDPVLRYIKRMRMREIQEWLMDYDIKVDVP